MAEVRESYLLRIASDPPARIWSGFGNLEIPMDIVEPARATYLGAGQLLSATDFQYLINGVAERIEFEVSGVSDETVRLALEDAPSVRNAAVHMGRIDFDEHWQQMGPVEWEAVFRADSLTIESQGGNGSRARVIRLSVGSADTGRSYAPMAFFTDADQRRRSPTDLVFSHVAGITSGATRRFGAKGS
jgi:hypothetical protein